MIVTDKTTYAEIEPFEDAITERGKEQLIQAAQAKYGTYQTLTIDAFWGLIEGNISMLGNMETPSVLQVFWLRGFKDFLQQYMQLLERLQVPSDPIEDKKYQSGCVELTPAESMLVFTREYFALPSFFDAGKRTIGEYLTARKDSFNRAMMQHNFEQAQRAKFKTKK